MNYRIKTALFFLSSGVIALSSGSCFFRLLGDLLGDTIWLRGID
jgi:hypothetical protein